jgi:hypothetical protein
MARNYLQPKKPTLEKTNSLDADENKPIEKYIHGFDNLKIENQ